MKEKEYEYELFFNVKYNRYEVVKLKEGIYYCGETVAMCTKKELISFMLKEKNLNNKTT